jgi:hypothetical protein
MTFMNFRKRVKGLEKVTISRHDGGPVTILRKGGYEHCGKRYKSLEDIPGKGFLVVPETMTTEEWQKMAIKQQKKLRAESSEIK